MEVTATGIEGVLLVKPRIWGDERGYFVETWQRRRYASEGVDLPFVQDNHSMSRRGCLRGLHFQKTHPQGKLVMGFRTGETTSPDQVNAMKMMVALYGGTPFSRLFQNVREKLSLCYYCAARYDKASGMMMVDSGVETGNEQKAQEEILHQLELVKQGAFDDSELESTILTINNALKSTVDTLSGLENWYLTQILSGSDESPLDNAGKVSRITKDEIQAAASQITLDTVFFLAAKKEGQNQ